MKRLFASLALVVAAVTLSGCYYDPGYVRSTGYGGAYYSQVAPVYGNGYYVAPGYYDYYGYYGCCYAPGVGLWYGGGPYYRGGHGYRGYRGPGGHWQGAHGSVQHGHAGSVYDHHH